MALSEQMVRSQIVPAHCRRRWQALHAGDHRLGHVADGGVQLFHRQADGAAAVVVAVVGRLVAAGAEGLVAGAGQHDGAHARS
jgi:hypothetical protein